MPTPASKKPNTTGKRRALPPVVKQHIKWLEELLAEAEAVPTQHQQTTQFYKDNPKHPFAGIHSVTSDFIFNPTAFQKISSPALTLRIRHALTQVVPNTVFIAELGKKDTLEEHMGRVRAVLGELKSGNLNPPKEAKKPAQAQPPQEPTVEDLANPETPPPIRR